ncbi:hypothetical protein H4S00_006553, partial [Coemansia sp. D1744]
TGSICTRLSRSWARRSSPSRRSSTSACTSRPALWTSRHSSASSRSHRMDLRLHLGSDPTSSVTRLLEATRN